MEGNGGQNKDTLKEELSKKAYYMLDHGQDKEQIMPVLLEQGLTEDEAKEIFKEAAMKQVGRIRKIGSRVIIFGCVYILVMLVLMLIGKIEATTLNILSVFIGLIPIHAGFRAKAKLKGIESRF